MLDERIRNYIDLAADPVELGEILDLAPTSDSTLEVSFASTAASGRQRARERNAKIVAAAVFAGIAVLIAALALQQTETPDNEMPVASGPEETPSLAYSQFTTCLRVLDAPGPPEVALGDQTADRVTIDRVADFDARVELCQLAVNAEADLVAQGSVDWPRLPMSPAQAEGLIDGVTPEEVANGWEQTIDCLERGGFEVTADSEGRIDEFAYDLEVRFLLAACSEWHVDRLLEQVWFAEQVAVARGQLMTAVGAARTEIDGMLSSAEHAELAGLLEEATSLGCDTAFGDGSWITVFDDMPQPRCLIVGEEHDLVFFNKGYETATVSWPGGNHVLPSDSSFDTGRIGDGFAPGTHVVRSDPYGETTLYVIPAWASLSSRLGYPFVTFDTGLAGATPDEIEALLNIELVMTEPPTADTCEIRRSVSDPYSPPFAFTADENGELRYVLLDEREQCSHEHEVAEPSR